MSSILGELNKIYDRISDETFLRNKGLSNEVGIHVFCYDPSDELVVTAYFEELKKLENALFNLVECDLYNIFLSICE